MLTKNVKEIIAAINNSVKMIGLNKHVKLNMSK